MHKNRKTKTLVTVLMAVSMITTSVVNSFNIVKAQESIKENSSKIVEVNSDTKNVVEESYSEKDKNIENNEVLDKTIDNVVEKNDSEKDKDSKNNEAEVDIKEKQKIEVNKEEGKVKKLEIVSMTPVNGAVDVDPDGEMSITFNQSVEIVKAGEKDVQIVIMYDRKHDGKCNAIIPCIYGNILRVSKENPNKVILDANIALFGNHTYSVKVKKGFIKAKGSNEEFSGLFKGWNFNTDKNFKRESMPAFIVSESSQTIEQNEKLDIMKTIQVMDYEGKELADEKYRKVIFKSEDEAIATVSENGEVTGVNPGKTKIVITSPLNSYLRREVEITVQEGEEISKQSIDFQVSLVNPPEHFTLNEDAVITAVGKNNGKEAKEGTLIIALYNKEGNMINYSSVYENIQPGETNEIVGGFRLPKEGQYKVKIFVWDKLENMKNLSEVKEIEVK